MLIVDGDRVSERAIELALAQAKYVVEWARDGEGALEILRRTRVEVVIADSLLADMPGTTLMRRTRDAIGPGVPAFVFVSADRTSTTRIGLLLGGARDYVIKPFLAEELRVRVQHAVEERAAARAAQLAGVTGLAGDCEHVSIPDLLTMLEFARRSGTVLVSVGPATGRLVVSDGRVVHAELGNLSGEDAFFVILQFNGGLFRFLPGEVDSVRTLTARVSELLLESAVREDTARHERPDEEALKRTEASLRELGIVKTPIDLRTRALDTPLAPDRAALGAKLAVGLADPLLLGDLVLDHELARAPDSVRLELWAPQAEGAAALLGLASPPGYQVLAAALGDAPRRLHLRVEVPAGACVITLVDTEGRGAPPAEPPDGILLAPGRGELIALAPQRLADLTRRLTPPAHPAVLAVGGAALRGAVVRLGEDTGFPDRIRSAAQILDDDPRALLCELIRLATGTVR